MEGVREGRREGGRTPSYSFELIFEIFLSSLVVLFNPGFSVLFFLFFFFLLVNYSGVFLFLKASY